MSETMIKEATMTKGEMIDAMKGLASKASKEAALSSLMALIAQALAAGRPVKLPGLGTLKPKIRLARAGRNPISGEPLEIPAHRTVTFTPSPDLKARL